jgi:hypothetical protein
VPSGGGLGDLECELATSAIISQRKRRMKETDIGLRSGHPTMCLVAAVVAELCGFGQ